MKNPRIGLTVGGLVMALVMLLAACKPNEPAVSEPDSSAGTVTTTATAGGSAEDDSSEDISSEPTSGSETDPTDEDPKPSADQPEKPHTTKKPNTTKKPHTTKKPNATSTSTTTTTATNKPTTAPTLSDDERLIDNFENYGTDEESALTNYEPYPGGSSEIEMYIDGYNAHTGKYGGRIDFSMWNSTWAGISRGLNYEDWSGYQTLCFWAKGDGNGRLVSFQVENTEGEKYSYGIWLFAQEYTLYEIPLASFSGIDSVADLKDLVVLTVSFSGGGDGQSIWLDDIKLSKEESALYEEVDQGTAIEIDNFEGYAGLQAGDDLLYYAPFENLQASVVLDGEHQAPGSFGNASNFCAAATYTSKSSGFGRTIQQNWLNHNVLSVYIRGDGKAHKVTFQVQDKQGAYWKSDPIEISGTEGHTYNIPITSLKQPSWQAGAGTLTINPTMIHCLWVFLDDNGNDVMGGTVYFDDLRVLYDKDAGDVVIPVEPGDDGESITDPHQGEDVVNGDEEEPADEVLLSGEKTSTAKVGDMIPGVSVEAKAGETMLTLQTGTEDFTAKVGKYCMLYTFSKHTTGYNQLYTPNGTMATVKPGTDHLQMWLRMTDYTAKTINPLLRLYINCGGAYYVASVQLDSSYVGEWKLLEVPLTEFVNGDNSLTGKLLAKNGVGHLGMAIFNNSGLDNKENGYIWFDDIRFTDKLPNEPEPSEEESSEEEVKEGPADVPGLSILTAENTGAGAGKAHPKWSLSWGSGSAVLSEDAKQGAYSLKVHTDSVSLCSATSLCSMNTEAVAIKLWLKTTAAGSITFNIMPGSGNWYKYTLNLSEAYTDWTEVTIPIEEIKYGDTPLNKSGADSIWQCQFDLHPAAEADIYFDDMRFVLPEEEKPEIVPDVAGVNILSAEIAGAKAGDVPEKPTVTWGSGSVTLSDDAKQGKFSYKIRNAGGLLELTNAVGGAATTDKATGVSFWAKTADTGATFKLMLWASSGTKYAAQVSIGDASDWKQYTIPLADIVDDSGNAFTAGNSIWQYLVYLNTSKEDDIYLDDVRFVVPAEGEKEIVPDVAGVNILSAEIAGAKAGDVPEKPTVTWGSGSVTLSDDAKQGKFSYKIRNAGGLLELTNAVGGAATTDKATGVSFWAKTADTGATFKLMLWASSGTKYAAQVSIGDASDWKQYTIPLADIVDDSGNAFTAGNSIWQYLVYLNTSKEDDIYLDDVRFVTE